MDTVTEARLAITMAQEGGLRHRPQEHEIEAQWPKCASEKFEAA